MSLIVVFLLTLKEVKCVAILMNLNNISLKIAKCENI